jgi:hypothetical protein
MKEENKTRGMARGKKNEQGRWRRNEDGTLRYVGICPFNRGVCALRNAVVGKVQKGE